MFSHELPHGHAFLGLPNPHYFNFHPHKLQLGNIYSLLIDNVSNAMSLSQHSKSIIFHHLHTIIFFLVTSLLGLNVSLDSLPKKQRALSKLHYIRSLLPQKHCFNISMNKCLPSHFRSKNFPLNRLPLHTLYFLSISPSLIPLEPSHLKKMAHRSSTTLYQNETKNNFSYLQDILLGYHHCTFSSLPRNLFLSAFCR